MGAPAGGDRAWAAARSLGELGELVAQWLEGRLSSVPTQVGEGGPDLETKALIGTLAAFNRAGFVTEHSQPAEPPQGGSAQRACVHGFCAKETAETIAAACLATDLVCLVYLPGGGEGPYVPVTIDKGRAFTWGAMPVEPEHVAYTWGRTCSPEAVATLIDAWQVCVIDPIWGRNDVLWSTLETALAGPPATGALPPFEDEALG
jgi:hypothetical protein